MRTFIVELTVDVDDDEEVSERDIEQIFEDIDPALGIVTVQNVTEE